MKAPRAAAIGATIAGIMVGFGAGQASAGPILSSVSSPSINQLQNINFDFVGDSANSGVGNSISPSSIVDGITGFAGGLTG